ncbi:hypothetical protein JYQ62_00750 [Nostoc sp. UHCC 0702]|nr:hypothetical protein JYQ62_00750 [Nostoc sp. UHCC 0702]
MGGFPHLMVRVAPLVYKWGFSILRSTIVKETSNGGEKSKSLSSLLLDLSAFVVPARKAPVL